MSPASFLSPTFPPTASSPEPGLRYTPRTCTCSLLATEEGTDDGEPGGDGGGDSDDDDDMPPLEGAPAADVE